MDDAAPAGVQTTTADSFLGTWTSARWIPLPGEPLCGLIDSIWYFDGRTTYARERVFPDGLAELIVHLDDVYRDPEAQWAPFPVICVNGVRTRAAVVQGPGKRCRVVGLRFTPRGAFEAMARPISDLLDVTIDVRNALGIDADVLQDACARAARHGPGAVIGAARGWVTRRMERAISPDPVTSWTADVIRAQRGDVMLERLRARTSLSRSRFAELFRREFGVTPKRYARIVRFRHALALLGSGEKLVEAATATGYSDQPHLYRDFCEFAGMTPAAFLKATRYPDTVSLAQA
jgi:AraC-like DNA-binding protein